MTEFSGEAGRMSNDQFPEETDYDRDSEYLAAKGATADDTGRNGTGPDGTGPDDTAAAGKPSFWRRLRSR